MKILILGAGGYLGGALYARCASEKSLSVYGTCRTSLRDGLHPLDILDEAASREAIEAFDPDVVVWCLKNQEREAELSHIGLRHILSLLKPAVRFIYISTGLSDGENQNEETPPEPRAEGMYLANYVNGKILGEELTRTHENHVILRPAQIYGFGAAGEMDERMLRVVQAVEKDGKMVRSANVYISTVHVEDLVSCIVELFYGSFTGTLCVAAENPVSYYEFYSFLARQVGICSDKVVAQYEAQSTANCFDTAKAQAILKTKFRQLC